jgi:hypothetical protein
MRAVLSNLIISVVSEEREDGEKNGPAKEEERIVCDSVSECGHVRESADGSPLDRWRPVSEPHLLGNWNK